MSGCSWRPHIESALVLDLSRMMALNAARPGERRSGSWHWTRDGEEVGIIGYTADLQDETGTLTLDYTETRRDGERRPVQCVIRLSSIPLHYGGRRWFLHCPYTHRRARKLYKFGSIDYFCHRTAVRPLPTYASQRTSGCDRIMAQRWAIRRKLDDTCSDLFGEPCKPKWMRWHTFNRYAARDAALAERENTYLARLLGRMMAKGS